jgi:hypothetical protein
MLLNNTTHALQSCIISHNIVLQELVQIASGVESQQWQSKQKSQWQMMPVIFIVEETL